MLGWYAPSSFTPGWTFFESELLGVKDGVNRVFTTPYHFDPIAISAYHNGRKMFLSGGEFTISESGGPGTGYDTITFLTFAPIPKSVLSASYVIAP